MILCWIDVRKDLLAGRLTTFHSGEELPKSKELSNLPIYYLSLFKIPKGVVEEIESLQNHFLWRGQDVYKPHLIKWQIVSKDKESGAWIWVGS